MQTTHQTSHRARFFGDLVVDLDVEASRALRRRAGGSAEPVVADEAGARLSEETARKGGQRREISADVRMCICDKRTKIYRFISRSAAPLATTVYVAIRVNRVMLVNLCGNYNNYRF